MALGPAAEVLRMWGERVDEIRPKIADDLRAALADFVVDGGAVVAPASTWAVTARARCASAGRPKPARPATPRAGPGSRRFAR